MFSLKNRRTKNQFYPLWIAHVAWVIIFRAVSFSFVLLIMDVFKSLLYVSVAGILMYVPSLLLMHKSTRLLNKLKINHAFYTIFLLALVSLGFIYIFLKQDNFQTFYIVGLLLAFLTLISNVELILFEKFVVFYTKQEKQPQFLSLSRQANSLSYFISPLTGGALMEVGSIHAVLLLAMGGVFSYLLFVFFLSFEEVSPLPTVKEKATHKLTFRELLIHSVIILIYNLNFIWLSTVNILLVPFLKNFYSSATVGVLASLNGIATIVGNQLYVYFDKPKFLKSSYILSSSVTIASLACVFIFLKEESLLSLFLLLGGFSSAWCYALAQSLANSVFKGPKFTEFLSIRTAFSIFSIITACLFSWKTSTFSFIKQEEYLAQEDFLSLSFSIVSSILFCLVFYLYPSVRKYQLKK